MSRARRQQKKRARRWKLEVRDTLFGWRASWWLKGREMHAARYFPKVETRFDMTGFAECFNRGEASITGRLPRAPEPQDLKPFDRYRRFTEALRLVIEADFAELEARVAARVARGA